MSDRYFALHDVMDLSQLYMTNPLEENMKSAIIKKYNDQETSAFLFY